MRIHEPHEKCLTESTRLGLSGISALGSKSVILHLNFPHRLGSQMNVRFWMLLRALRFDTACLLKPGTALAFERVGTLMSGRGYAIL